MAPEILERAIEPFFTTKEVGKGTGLGLSMAYGVATQSGGTLRISSHPDEGTTVTMWLRCAPEMVREQADGPAAVAEAALAGPGRHAEAALLVVVDDDRDVRGFVSDALEAAGYRVLAFPDGAEFLEWLEGHEADLALVDYAMPGLTGGDVAAQVRQQAPDFPILLMTGFADSARLAETIGSQVTMLRKPFGTEELLLLVGDRLRAAAAARAGEGSA